MMYQCNFEILQGISGKTLAANPDIDRNGAIVLPFTDGTQLTIDCSATGEWILTPRKPFHLCYITSQLVLVLTNIISYSEALDIIRDWGAGDMADWYLQRVLDGDRFSNKDSTMCIVADEQYPKQGVIK